MAGTEFEIMRCNYCGTKGVHIKCGNLDKYRPDFICDDHNERPEPSPDPSDQEEEEEDVSSVRSPKRKRRRSRCPSFSPESSRSESPMSLKTPEDSDTSIDDDIVQNKLLENESVCDRTITDDSQATEGNSFIDVENPNSSSDNHPISSITNLVQQREENKKSSNSDSEDDIVILEEVPKAAKKEPSSPPLPVISNVTGCVVQTPAINRTSDSFLTGDEFEPSAVIRTNSITSILNVTNAIGDDKPSTSKQHQHMQQPTSSKHSNVTLGSKSDREIKVLNKRISNYGGYAISPSKTMKKESKISNVRGQENITKTIPIPGSSNQQLKNFNPTLGPNFPNLPVQPVILIDDSEDDEEVEEIVVID